MGDIVITDAGEVVNEDKDVEIFDDDNREEEERQYLQDIDYDSVVISEKIKDKKILLKQKFDDLKKLNKDKKNPSKEILLLIEIIDIAQEKIKYEIVDCRIKGIKGTILILKANSLILNFFKKFLDDLRGKTSSNIIDFISDFDNLFLKEIISLSKSKIYLEYQDVRFNHDTIGILYHEDEDVLIKILEKQAQELLDAILHLDNEKGLPEQNKNKGNIQIAQIQILALTLAEQARVIKNTNIEQKALEINKYLMETMKASLTYDDYAIPDLNLIIVKATEIINLPKDLVAILDPKEQEKEAIGEAMEEAIEDAMEEETEDADEEYTMQEKILGILQYFIYTECIDVIKPSLADSIIALKLSSIKKDIELSKSKQCPSIEKSLLPSLLPSRSQSLTPSSPRTQPPATPPSPSPSPPSAGTGGGRKKKSKKKISLEFKF